MAVFNSVVRPRSLRAAFSWLLVLLLGLSACKTGRGARGEDIENKPPIQAESAEAQRRFERAMALLKAGKYEQARQAFRLVQAEFSGDPIATLAEVYVARASMGAVDPATSFSEQATANYAPSPEAARILASLARSEDVDNRIRYGAAAYYALEMALRGKTDEALAALRDYPSASLSNVVLDRDRLAVRSLLAESFWRAGRDIAALEAAARLYDEAAAALAAQTAETTPGTIERDPFADDSFENNAEPLTPAEQRSVAFLRSVEALARDRAFSIAEKDSEELVLQNYLTAQSPFLRAVAGWRLLERSLQQGAQGEISAEERAGLEDLFNQIAPDLVAIGATSRAAELSQRLAAVGGPKRLAVGFLLPLSGHYRAIGQRAMAGALVAMRAFHHPGQPEITLIFEDSQGDPSQVFQRLKQQEVLAVVGPLDADRARKFAPLARENQIPMITLTTESARAAASPEQESPDAAAEFGPAVEAAEDADETAPEQGPFVFRNFIDAAAEARASARIAFYQIGDRRAAVVYPDLGYGRLTGQAFVDEFRSLGGQIVAQIPYDRSKSDFSDVAARLAESGAQAVFVPDSAEKVAVLSAFFANENIWGIMPDAEPSRDSRRMQVHYLGTSLWEDPILVRQAADYVEGATIPVWFSTSLAAPEVQRFVQRFEAIYGRRPGAFAAFSFDTVGWLRALMLERGMRRAVAIRDALLTGGVYRGVTGEAHMGPNGESRRALRFVTPTSEGFVPLPFRADTAERSAPAYPTGESTGNSSGNSSGDDEVDGATPPDSQLPPRTLPQ
jgi:ABC-type branched-subunit amino acid transport system substrate-binding protein